MSAPVFLCDDMFQGLARWLRAAGYDAVCCPGIPDGDLVRRARTENRLLITSDSRMLERRIIRRGEVKTLFVPGGLSNEEALTFVMKKFGLELREARCMLCGGTLDTVAKESVQSVVPPIAFNAYNVFFRCSHCGQVFWHGTHWGKICATLERAAHHAAG